MSINPIHKYYNEKEVAFCMGARRKRRTYPMLSGFHKKKILDVGCATGYVGAFLKKNDNYVVGIDVSKKDVDQAKKVLDKAFVMDVESDDLKKLGKGFDLIIVAEVPEHLFDPEKVFKKLLTLLKPSGRILISTPNVVHAYIRLKFLFGVFSYKEETVINKSHIHFFTRSELLRVINDLGLTVEVEDDVILPEFMRFILKYWPNLFAHQMVILCKRK